MTHIQYQKGDIFEAKAQVIVNTVNCKGVMGKGLALAFKQRYPEMFPVYQQECKTGKLRIGRPTLYQESTPWILNFPTKDNWKANSKLEYLEKGLAYFVANHRAAGITSIAFPKLGAQNGKLSWDDVGPLMAKYLSKVDIDVSIYIAEGDREYQSDAQAEINAERAIWQQFNELALSLDRLMQEVLLSQREANKVAEQRKSTELQSFADIEALDDLAKISLTRIKQYINHQRHAPAELPGMAKEEKSTLPRTKSKVRSSRKAQRNASYHAHQLSTAPLFLI